MRQKKHNVDARVNHEVTTIDVKSLSMEDGEPTYTNTLSIPPGSGYLKLYANNNNSQPYRITLQSVDYPHFRCSEENKVLDWNLNSRQRSAAVTMPAAARYFSSRS
ncbi:hypothetical protein [Paenibacillus donghaensis]|uniref:hypothetical protein n=1 Tax=Paenibacillus donghaensis TaxID=414771 RepID=UPI0012F8E595|nr:hypothetical protein [Paenibacillus donghaensis]